MPVPLLSRKKPATGAALLWRMKASNVLPVLEELPDGSHRSAVHANPKGRRNNTDAIPVRVIEYTVTSGENTNDFRLMTTILDPETAPAQDLAELYGRRWEIVSYFDELKTHQRGPASSCAPKPPTEFCRKSTATSASTTPCGPSSAKSPYCSRKTPYGFPSRAPSGQHGEPSPTGRLFPPDKLRNAFANLSAEILHNLLPPRRRRSNPRVVKRKMSGWPLKRIPEPSTKPPKYTVLWLALFRTFVKPLSQALPHVCPGFSIE